MEKPPSDLAGIRNISYIFRDLALDAESSLIGRPFDAVPHGVDHAVAYSYAVLTKVARSESITDYSRTLAERTGEKVLRLNAASNTQPSTFSAFPYSEFS